MSLSPKIAAALDARPDTGAPPRGVTVEDGPHRLSLELTASGPVGLAFRTLEFTTRARPEWSPDALRAWGDRLAARVTYLMEPLVVLEHDRDGGELELRSQAPSARGSQRAYYEVRLHREGRLSLTRTTFDEASRERRPALCQMTREMIERLADDLVVCVG